MEQMGPVNQYLLYIFYWFLLNLDLFPDRFALKPIIYVCNVQLVNNNKVVYKIDAIYAFKI
jgi:hypothetical protein